MLVPPQSASLGPGSHSAHLSLDLSPLCQAPSQSCARLCPPIPTCTPHPAASLDLTGAAAASCPSLLSQTPTWAGMNLTEARAVPAPGPRGGSHCPPTGPSSGSRCSTHDQYRSLRLAPGPAESQKTPNLGQPAPAAPPQLYRPSRLWLQTLAPFPASGPFQTPPHSRSLFAGVK